MTDLWRLALLGGLLLGLMGVGAAESVDPESDADRYYSFDDFNTGDSVFIDESGNGNDLSVEGDGTVSSISGADADSDGAVDMYDGLDNTWAEGSGFDFTGTGELAASFWIRSDGVSEDSYWLFAESPGIIMAEIPEGHQNEGLASFRYNDADDDWKGEIVSGKRIDDDEWHHVVFQYDSSSGEREIWIDGNLEASEVEDAPNLDTEEFFIGDISSRDRIADFRMDELALFDSALSDSEIQSLYNLEYSNDPPVFEDVSSDPSPPQIGENVSYSADVVDSSGNLDQVCLDLEEDGQTVVSAACQTVSGSSANAEWLDIHIPKSGDSYWLNATFELSDTQGGTAVEELNYFLEDTPPEVNIVKPDNSTYWSYDVPFEILVDADNDAVPDQEFDLSLFNRGTYKEQRIDGFESGNFNDEDPFNWQIRDDPGNSGEIQVQQQFVSEGDHALQIHTEDAVDGSIEKTLSENQEIIFQEGAEFGFDIRSSEIVEGPGSGGRIDGTGLWLENEAGDTFSMGFEGTDQGLEFSIIEDGTRLETIDGFDPDTWYSVEAELFNDSIQVSVVEKDTQQEYSLSGEITADRSYNNVYLGNSPSDGDLTAYFDEISIPDYQIEKFTGTGTQTFTGEFQQDIDSNVEFVATAEDSGGTTTKTEQYTVNDVELDSIYGEDTTMETLDSVHNIKLDIGEMIENVEYELVWNSEIWNSTEKEGNGIQQHNIDLTNQVPLVEQNNTEVDWYWSYTVNRTTLNGETVTETYQTNEDTQTVGWGFTLKNSKLLPSNQYLEDDTAEHQIEINAETLKPDFTGETVYNRTSETHIMEVQEEEDLVTLTGEFNVGLMDEENKTVYNAEGTATVEYLDSERQITADNDLEVHKIILTTCDMGMHSEKALKFNMRTERDGQQPVNADLFLDLTLINNQQERRYHYIEQNDTEHTFCLYPDFAEVQIQTGPEDLIQYEKSDEEGVLRSYFFPEPETIYTDSVTEVELLNAHATDTIRTRYEIEDSTGESMPGVFCRIDRKFPGLGIHKTVAMIKTGAEGNSETFLELNEIYYSHTCYQDGEQVDTFDDQILSDPVRLQMGAEETETILDFQSIFDASCTYNATQLDCTYQSQTDQLKKAELVVKQKQVVQDQEICRKESTTRTGGLSCSGLNTTENTYTYQVTGHYPGDSRVNGASGVIGVHSDTVYGAAGLILTLILFMVIFIASAQHILLGIGIGTAWLLASSIIGFFPMTAEQRATLVAVVIVIGAVINR